MKIYHPDKNPKGKKLAEKIAKKLNEAHDVLKNQDSRIKYDEEHRFTQTWILASDLIYKKYWA